MASGKALSSRVLGALAPVEAAALFVVRRSEGLTPAERSVLNDWLAADTSHRKALAEAERAWRVLDEPDDSEILTAMRDHALAQGPRMEPNWRRASAAVLVAGGMLVAIVSGSRLLMHLRRVLDRPRRPL